jgi:hypothetical protein
LVALGILIWQIVLIFIQFYKYEVAVQIELEFEQRTFPAVTICDLNPYKKSVAYGYSRIDRLTTTYLYTMRKLACSSYPDCSIETNETMEENTKLYGIDSINDTVALQTKIKRILNLEAAQYDMTSAKAELKDFIHGCSFNSEDCIDGWGIG